MDSTIKVLLGNDRRKRGVSFVSSTTQLLKQVALEQGFHAVGIARVPASQPGSGLFSDPVIPVTTFSIACGIGWPKATTARWSGWDELPNGVPILRRCCRTAVQFLPSASITGPTFIRMSGGVTGGSPGMPGVRIIIACSRQKLKALERALKALEPDCSHTPLRGHGPGDGEILGTAGRLGVDRQTFQPRLPCLRLVAAAGRNFNHRGVGA